MKHIALRQRGGSPIVKLIILAIIGVVVHQRLNNKEDDYYEKNIDK